MNKITDKARKEALGGVDAMLENYSDTQEEGLLPCRFSLRELRTIRSALEGIDAVIKKATEMVNCSHELCSMNEAVYEEIHGEMFLNVVNSCCGGIEVADE